MSDEKLTTIQKRNNLNTVYRIGEVGLGGAYHQYNIYHQSDPERGYETKTEIKFQNGPRNDPSSIGGVLDADLLEIVRDRLRAFQSGPFACRENACALTHIEEALMWMNKRIEDRTERGVLGTYNK